MKKYLLLCTALTILSSAHAADLNCVALPDCADLGFSMSESDCAGQFSLKCPFDNTKLFCVGEINDGAACQTALANPTKITSFLDTAADKTSTTSYLVSEDLTGGGTIGDYSNLKSYCSQTKCYCKAIPTITLNNSLTVKNNVNFSKINIEAGGTYALNIFGKATFSSSSLNIESYLNLTNSGSKAIFIGDNTSSYIENLMSPLSPSYTYAYTIGVAYASLVIKNIGFWAGYSSSIVYRPSKITINLYKSSNSTVVVNGGVFRGDSLSDCQTVNHSGPSELVVQVCPVTNISDIVS